MLSATRAFKVALNARQGRALKVVKRGPNYPRTTGGIYRDRDGLLGYTKVFHAESDSMKTKVLEGPGQEKES